MTESVSATKRARFTRVLSRVCLLLGALPALAQDYGDTPYVQTPQNVVEKMLEVAAVGPNDYVVDLGSGDGRMVITAAKEYRARGFGVDLDRRLVALANQRAAKAGVADRAVFYERDLYKTDVSRATVLTLYLLPEVNLMVRGKLLATLKPGTRIVSHDYDMGEWHPDRALVIDAPTKPVGKDHKSKIFYWVVPATVSGSWRWKVAAGGQAHEFELALEQMFQEITGTLKVDGRPATIESATLKGANIDIKAAADGSQTTHYEFAGRVVKERIEGTARLDDAREPVAWRAVRTKAVEPKHAVLKPPPPPTYQW